MFVLTLTDDKLLKFVLIWGESCVAFVWGEKLGWPRTLFIILLVYTVFIANLIKKSFFSGKRKPTTTTNSSETFDKWCFE